MTDAPYLSVLEFREDDSRTSPGRISGVVLPLGRVAGDRREVFTPGSVTWPADGVRLLAEHRGREVMRFFPVEQAGEIRIDAALPDTQLGREVAVEIRSGHKRGLSVEFHALTDAVVQGVREIRAALVQAAAVVHAGAYDQALAEVRARQRRRVWL